MSIDLKSVNQTLNDKDAVKTIQWALSLNLKSIVTTNFGPDEAVILHLITQHAPTIQVVWIDSGYNTKKTYAFAESLIQKLSLNIDVYTPRVSAARCDAVYGGVPTVDSPLHKVFTEQFKLEPFNRAMKEHNPDLWFTAVRREQTAFRQDMDIVSEGIHGSIKVAPVLGWTAQDMESYRQQHSLPNEENYYDPTKALSNRECGLHTITTNN